MSEEKRQPCCQDCRFQRNNPSFCREDEKFVPRKQKPCKKFK